MKIKFVFALLTVFLFSAEVALANSDLDQTNTELSISQDIDFDSPVFATVDAVEDVGCIIYTIAPIGTTELIAPDIDFEVGTTELTAHGSDPNLMITSTNPEPSEERQSWYRTTENDDTMINEATNPRHGNKARDKIIRS
jgi:hypothetical protein